MTKFLSHISILLIAFSCVFISYFIDRGEFLCLIMLTGVAFLGYFYLLLKSKFTLNQIIGWSIFLRVLLLFNTPNLSDDYYRFIWDGGIIVRGENPYLHLPSELINESNYTKSNYYNTLYKGLNSKEYYTVYPPLNQFTFAIASYLGGDNIYISIVALKLILLFFEIGILFVLFSLLKLLKLSANLAIIYAFNPLVIIELIGNVHFEGMMLFFFLFGVLMLFKNRIVFAGVLFACAISVKLIPLMLLPLVIGLIGWRRSLLFYATITLVSLALFMPFLSYDLIMNFSESIDLYFQKFEFNASIYYLLRWVGIELTGYNQIAFIGTILPVVMVGVVLFFTVKQIMTKNKAKAFFNNVFIVLFAYYLLASIVHPWYIINLVLLSVFIRNKITLVWSITVFLSYYAYSNYINLNYGGDKHQSSIYFLLVFIEYMVLLGYLVYFRLKRSGSSFHIYNS